MTRIAVARSAAARLTRRCLARWEVGVVAGGVVAAGVAMIVTLRADFLAYPGWLAIQKADLILGPIGVGVYWCRRRPQSRFGPLLVAFGFLHVPYIFQSSSNSVLFTLGVHWEGIIYLATLWLILSFPSGRLRRLDRLILVAAALGVVVPSSLITLFSPQIFAGGSISACRAACPANELVISDKPSLLAQLFDLDRAAIITVAFGAAALLLWRLVTGTPPQRRALAIGTPIALVFLVTQATYQVILALGGADLGLNPYVRWTFVVARSALWYGFLLALIASQLFAGRVLRQIVADSLRRPALRELAALLRRPLGDPGLQLVFWDAEARRWTDGEGIAVDAPSGRSGRVLTEVEREGRPAAAIAHDAQLADDPELLQAAGTTALLALENAELQVAWQASLRELRESRARIAAAGARERLRLERDLHDGAQQRLFAIQIRLDTAREQADDGTLERELEEIAVDAAAAVDELRALAHGLYPTILRERGLPDALRSIAQRAAIPLQVVDGGVDRCSASVEEAVYYCVREAIQNSTKHAGRGARVTVTLERRAADLEVTIVDDGKGFDPDQHARGMGLVSMRDRIGAVGGEVEIGSRPGHGTTIRATVPGSWAADGPGPEHG